MSQEKRGKHSLFAGVPPETVDRLLEGAPRKHFKKGETLLKQGKRELQAHLLTEGRVGVFAEAPTGIKSAMVFHEAPFLVGGIELWMEKPNLGSVVAMEPCSSIVFSKKAFQELLQKNHQICINLVQLLSNLTYQIAQERRTRIFGNVEHLVASTLLSFAQFYGEEHRYGILIRKDVTKSEIAEILGVNRRSVIRAVESLHEEKLIDWQDRQCVVPDLSKLREKALAPFPDFVPDSSK